MAQNILWNDKEKNMSVFFKKLETPEYGSF